MVVKGNCVLMLDTGRNPGGSAGGSARIAVDAAEGAGRGTAAAD